MKKRTKKTISVSLKVFTRLLLGIFLCFIMWVSMGSIAMGIFSDEVGYRILEEQPDGTVKYQEEEYRYKEGEAPSRPLNSELNEGRKEGDPILAAEPIYETNKTAATIIYILSQIAMLIVWGIFPYNILWQFGNRDDTNVRYKGQRPDPWRGVKIGALAMIPFAVLWVLLVVANLTGWNGFTQVYTLSMMPFFHYNSLVLGEYTVIADVAVWRLLLLLPTLLFIPAVSGIAYRMGGTQFSIAEFITFKKKKETAEEEEI